MNMVSIPWKACLLIGVFFGFLLCVSSKFNNLLINFIIDMEFHKLTLTVFLSLAGFLILFMVSNFKFLNKKQVLPILVGFIFNGVIGGYLGLGVWNIYIGQVNDGIDFFAWAWIMYVWFFLTLNVINYGVPSNCHYHWTDVDKRK